MFATDCKFLENELLDVVRLFKRRPKDIKHSFKIGGRYAMNSRLSGWNVAMQSLRCMQF